MNASLIIMSTSGRYIGNDSPAYKTTGSPLNPPAPIEEA